MKFFFLYFYLIVFCCLYSCQTIKTTSGGQSPIDLTKLQERFEQGKYCELLPLLDTYLTTIREGREDWQLAKILTTKTYLELEKWNKAVQVVDALEKNDAIQTTKNKYQIDLLKVRILEGKENIIAVEPAYQALISKLQKEAGHPHLLAEAQAYNGIFQNYIGNYEAAEVQILGINKSLLTPSLTAKVYNNLAYLYSQQSRATASEHNFLKALTILKNHHLEQHPYYALCLNDYALLNLYKGAFAVADSLLTQSEQLNQVCPILSTTGFNYSTRGDIQYKLGAFPAAKENLEKALQVFLEIPLHQEASAAAFKIGEVYYSSLNLEAAATAYQQALMLHQQFIGKKAHIHKGLILQGMGSLEVYNWNYEQADSLYELGVQIIANTLGKENSNYATALNNLASSKEAQTDYEQALSLYQQTAHLDTLLYGKKHPYYKTTLFNLARCYTKMDNSAQALANYQEGINLQLQLLDDYFGGFSEETRLTYLTEAMLHFDVFNTYACFKEDAALHTIVQNLNLATKNRILDFSIQTQQLQLENQPESVKEMYQQWQQQKELLAKVSLQSTKEREATGISIDSLAASINILEKQLTRHANLRLAKEEAPSFETLRSKLTEKEAAIDFFNFFVTDEYGQFPDSIFYFALITRPEWTAPKLIQLLEDKELKEILELSSHYSLNAEVNNYLYQKIWAPLEPYLEGVSTIHLSAEGWLHQISFAGLFPNPDSDQSLLEQYQFYYYSNLKDIKQQSDNDTISQKILVLANADYNAGLKAIDKENNEYFISLPGTKLELDFLQDYSKRNNFPMDLYQSTTASEPAFRESIRSFKPTIIHLATHGFFKSKDTTNYEINTLGTRIKTAENSLLRSGLVFTGVNQHWTASQTISPTEDGVLTALEVANLDLSNTDLVVLSACNTGRGSLQDGEGLFGLQRAFKLAGVKYTLVSLWAIPDQQTAELMTYFYDFLATPSSPQQALYLAQKEMQKQYNSPFNWAGFVLLE